MEIEGIRLSSEEGHTLVEVEVEGIWYLVLRDVVDKNFIHHTVTSGAIEKAVYYQNLALLKD